MADAVDWRQDNAQDILAEAVTRLSAGQLVQLPTESGPILACLAIPAAIERLRSQSPANEPLAIALPQPLAVFDWLPHLRGTGRRLIEKFWPGPLTLVFPGGHQSGIAAHLTVEVRRLLLPDDRLALRLPDHDWVSALIPSLPAPLVVATCSASAGDWIVRDEPAPFAHPATVVEIGARSARVLSEGAITRDEIEDACLARVLFVCTGNTCRSPMTGALCRKLLADHFGCTAADLSRHGYVVESAGLAASLGGAASPEAVQVVADWGASLDDHASQPVTQQLVTRADRIYTMTLAHERWLLTALPDLPVQTLAPDRDIADPIGGDHAIYLACAEQILTQLKLRLSEILEM